MNKMNGLKDKVLVCVPGSQELIRGKIKDIFGKKVVIELGPNLQYRTVDTNIFSKNLAKLMEKNV